MTILNDIATLEDVDRAVFTVLKNLVVVHPSSDWVAKEVAAGNPAPTHYDVLGHQPYKKALSNLDQEQPLVWVRRKGAPEESDVGSAGPGEVVMVATDFDVDGNPAKYEALTGGQIVDIPYEIRYLAFHESDERAIISHLVSQFPAGGLSLFGPGGKGPFFFELVFATDVPGTRENELGGLYNIKAKNVCLGERIAESDIPAITDLQVIPNVDGDFDPAPAINEGFEQWS